MCVCAVLCVRVCVCGTLWKIKLTLPILLSTQLFSTLKTLSRLKLPHISSEAWCPSAYTHIRATDKSQLKHTSTLKRMNQKKWKWQNKAKGVSRDNLVFYLLSNQTHIHTHTQSKQQRLTVSLQGLIWLLLKEEWKVKTSTSCLLRGTPLFHSLRQCPSSFLFPLLFSLPCSFSFLVVLLFFLLPCLPLSLSPSFLEEPCCIQIRQSPYKAAQLNTSHIIYPQQAASSPFTAWAWIVWVERRGDTFELNSDKVLSAATFPSICVCMHVCLLTNAANWTVKILQGTKMQFTCTVPTPP